MSVPIAYIAGAFPTRSETFVYREVRGLRAAGWHVTTVSLNPPKERGLADFADLEVGTVFVYGEGVRRTVMSALAELLAHPVRSAATVFTALADALRPAEPMPAAARVKLLGQSAAALGVARRLREAGVRHVHCHFAHAPATLGMYAARQLGIPFSFTGHANDLFQRRALLARKLRRAAFVACISEWHREFYRQIVADRADRYDVIRCGVDVEGWTLKADSARDIPPGDPLRVLTVCRLVEKKGIDTLIQALARLSRPWKLTVAGDGPERQRLEVMARELGCFDSIEWLGAVDNARVRELLGAADAFALPCREDRHGDRDGIPVVLMEAMACGVPVIAGDLPAIRELVRHEHTGIVVDGKQPEQLTAAIARLARDGNLRLGLAQSARRHVESEFSLRVALDRLAADVHQAVERSAASTLGSSSTGATAATI